MKTSTQMNIQRDALLSLSFLKLTLVILISCFVVGVTPAETQVPISLRKGNFKRVRSISGEAILRLADGASLQNLSAKYLPGIKLKRQLRSRGKLKNTYLVTAPKGAYELCKSAVRRPGVVSCQPNFVYQALMLPDDTFLDPDQNGSWSRGSWLQKEDDLWGLKRIGADRAWSTTEGEGVTVAVIDTGLDINHPDIADNVWINPCEDLNHNGVVDVTDINGLDDSCAGSSPNGFVDDFWGWSFAGSSNVVQDDHGHGTHVAGTIAALRGNGEGIVGVAPRAKIMTIKGLNSDGAGTEFALAQAILYAAENGASVINNSWGLSGPLADPDNADLIGQAVKSAIESGSVVVFASGNSSSDVGYTGATAMNNPKPIVVGASTPKDRVADFSNFGFLVDLVAPGGGIYRPAPAVPDPKRLYYPRYNILSLRAEGTFTSEHYSPFLVEGRYIRLAGTSMAAPHVSGAVALIRSKYPSISPEEIRVLLRQSADDIEKTGSDALSGAGRLNIERALTGDPFAANALLDYPASGTLLSRKDGSITITGTVGGANFSHFTIDYQSRKSSLSRRGSLGWIPLTTIAPTQPHVDSPLAHWIIGELPTGDYDLRLTAFTHEGKQIQSYSSISLFEAAPNRLATSSTSQFAPAISGNSVAWIEPQSSFNDSVRISTTTSTPALVGGSGYRYVISPIGAGDTLFAWAAREQDNRWSVSLFDLNSAATNVLLHYPSNHEIPALTASADRVSWIHIYPLSQTQLSASVESCRFDSLASTCPVEILSQWTLSNEDYYSGFENLQLLSSSQLVAWIDTPKELVTSNYRPQAPVTNTLNIYDLAQRELKKISGIHQLYELNAVIDRDITYTALDGTSLANSPALYRCSFGTTTCLTKRYGNSILKRIFSVAESTTRPIITSSSIIWGDNSALKLWSCSPRTLARGCTPRSLNELPFYYFSIMSTDTQVVFSGISPLIPRTRVFQLEIAK